MSFYDPKLVVPPNMDPQQQYYGYQTYMPPQNMRVPLNQSSLTQDEISKLKTSKPTVAFNIQISEDEHTRAMCNHYENGVSRVVRLNDGTNRCYCPICQSVWSPYQFSKEEIRQICDQLISAMQSVKYAGELTANVIREYFSMIPLIDKFPDLYDYAIKNCNSFMDQAGYNNGQDASIYAIYNSMFSPNMYNMTPPQQGYYGMPQQQGYYYNPQQQPQNPNMMSQQNMYYNPSQNPMTNPMQIQPQQTPQGYYQPPVNQQFTSQANMMMAQNNPQQPGMIPPQPPIIQPNQQMGVPQQPYMPTYAAPQPQQPVVEQKSTKIDL